MKRLLLASVALLSHEPAPASSPATRPSCSEIRRDFDAGASVRDLARRHGMTLSEVTKAIRSERRKERR